MGTYVTNTWYPLTWSRDVGSGLTKHRILERDVVVYRKSDGSTAALEDLCPHRFLPLSEGALKGDNVQCGYHGMTFDGAGTCVRIPGQAGPPPVISVPSFPTTENMGLVWIWMGDPDKADPTTVFDLPEYHSPEWSAVEGDALRIEANYLNLADNLCDPAHVSFVHLTTLGNAASEDIPVEHEAYDETVLTWRWVLDAPPIPLFAKYGNYQGNVDRWHYYHYLAPSIAIIDFGSADVSADAPGGNRADCMQIFACHFMTPVDEHTSIDHWLHVKNFTADDATNKQLSDDFRVAFAEDKAVLEAIEVNEQRYAGRRKARIAIDMAPTKMRRLLDKLIAGDTERVNPAPRVRTMEASDA